MVVRDPVAAESQVGTKRDPCWLTTGGFSSVKISLLTLDIRGYIFVLCFYHLNLDYHVAEARPKNLFLNLSGKRHVTLAKNAGFLSLELHTSTGAISIYLALPMLSRIISFLQFPSSTSYFPAQSPLHSAESQPELAPPPSHHELPSRSQKSPVHQHLTMHPTLSSSSYTGLGQIP